MTTTDLRPAAAIDVVDITTAAGVKVFGHPRPTTAGLSVRVASRDDLERLAFYAASELNETWAVTWDGTVDCEVGGVAVRWAL